MYKVILLILFYDYKIIKLPPFSFYTHVLHNLITIFFLTFGITNFDLKWRLKREKTLFPFLKSCILIENEYVSFKIVMIILKTKLEF